MYCWVVLSCAAVALLLIAFLVHRKPGPRVTVLLGDPRLPDKVKKGGAFSDYDFEMVNHLKSTLAEMKGYEFHYLDEHGSLLKALTQNPPAFVFNLCDEGFMNSSKMELHVSAVLEMLNIPYTGSGPTCLATCFNKALVANYAKSVGIPVPREIVVAPSVMNPPIPDFFPALLKPALGDGSIGIARHSVVQNEGELREAFQSLKKLLPHTPILIQEFLSGREFSVGIVGNVGSFHILPLMEVDYSELPPHLPKILAYESKWDNGGSPYWNNIVYKPAEIDSNRQTEMVDYALQMFKLMECRDYAVFDFREDRAGQIRFLEVNPNPGWGKNCTIVQMAGFQGMDYKTLLQNILLAAEKRWSL